jgi:hypothetical protein
MRRERRRGRNRTINVLPASAPHDINSKTNLLLNYYATNVILYFIYSIISIEIIEYILFEGNFIICWWQNQQMQEGI